MHITRHQSCILSALGCRLREPRATAEGRDALAHILDLSRLVPPPMLVWANWRSNAKGLLGKVDKRYEVGTKVSVARPPKAASSPL